MESIYKSIGEILSEDVSIATMRVQGDVVVTPQTFIYAPCSTIQQAA
jgi:hypothetical protein